MELKYFNLKGGKVSPPILKKMWREIVVKVHPDKPGGSHQMYLDAQKEYDWLLKNGGIGYTAKQDSPESYGSFDEFLANISALVRKKFAQAYPIAGKNLEVCTYWLWTDAVPGSDVAKNLESIGFQWAPEKERYYWQGVPKIGSETWEMNEIRRVFGSRTFKDKSMKIPRK